MRTGIRKIEFDKDGNIIHVYTVWDDHDPHLPNEGVEISEDYATLHEEMKEFLSEFKRIYIFDSLLGLRKRKEYECKPEDIPYLKDFEEIPKGFVKKIGRRMIK